MPRKDGPLVKLARQTETAFAKGSKAAESSNLFGKARAGTASILTAIGRFISGCGSCIKPENAVEPKKAKRKTKRKTKKT